MDLLERPEIKSTYDKCKYIVKLWEHDFKKLHGRLPSKLDIREADRTVRDAYRKYYQIKTAALEQSFKDVDGFNLDEENANAKVSTSSTSPDLNTICNELQSENKSEPTDETWGTHLNKKVGKAFDKKTDLNISCTTKIFGGSKLSKRYSRKSLSFSQRRSETSFDSSVLSQSTQLSQPTQSLSQPIESSQSIHSLSQPTHLAKENTEPIEDELFSFEGIFNRSNIKVTSTFEKTHNTPTNIVQSVMENNYHRSLKSVDPGWLQRVGISTGLDVEDFITSQGKNLVEHDESAPSLGYDSDDIIDNSDEECSVNLGHTAKKLKIDNISKSENSYSVLGVNKNQDENNFEVIANKNNDEGITLDQTRESVAAEKDPFEFNDETSKNNCEFLNVKEKAKNNSEVLNVNEKAKNKKKTTEKNIKKVNLKKKSRENNSQVIRKSSRTTKTQAVMAESHSEDEDPFHSDNDDKDPEFSVVENKNKFSDMVVDPGDPLPISKKKNHSKQIVDTGDPSPISKKKSYSKQKSSKTKPIENEKEDENETYELEYSIKPRVAAPRFRNLKKLIQIETSADVTDNESDDTRVNKSQIKGKRQQELEKLEKKIQSGSLNDNFVTINLKKKIYSRGKKTMTFSKFKKQQWKNKKKALAGPNMDMGGCDGGMLTCFTCGQIGHFARNCKQTKGDALLPLAADEEVCPFPTLEEATQMAKESALVIRKPNVAVEKTNQNEEIEETRDSSDDDIFDDGETELLLTEALKVEEHVAKLNLQSYLDHVSTVQPYYKTKEDGSVVDTPDEVFSALKKFGHSSFRPGQEQAVMRILSGKSTLVTLSTGSGKSLCYQLPAYLYSKREPCISLIISPLVSLMEDQVTGIPSFLKAACLHTNLTKSHREKVMDLISSGQLNVLLVSPEAVVAGEKQSGFGSLLRKLPPIAFACIDEAHCVSQWSHNFRPSYLMICRVLREKMGVRTVLGLTATATRATSDSIIQHLQIPDGREGIISDVPLPDNLILTVSKDYERDQALLSLLSSERFANCKSIIIYCTRREECDRLTRFLRTTLHYEKVPTNNKKRKRLSVQAEPYHAGLAASRRRTIQKAFMSGELRIVVATVAFGMGINKSDIRAVIHYNMPKNFESYVQEIGRAGRDGLPAHCHLFLDAKGNDENELRRHIYANSIDRHVIRKLLQRIFVPCSCKGTCPKHEVAFSIEETVRALDIPEENISTLLCYLELHEKKYIELLSPAYTVCKVVSYGGPMQIRKVAKECPPLAMALALQKNKENEPSVIEFAVVDIAAAIGWDSGICKHKLKNLEWTSVNGLPKRSTLNVTFSNLGFRVLAPGNLDDEQLDEALDSLYEHVVKQEKTALLQLRAVHETLVGVAEPSYRSCLSTESTEDNTKLKFKIRNYFNSPNPLDSIELTDNKLVDEEQVVNNIRGLISSYRDNNFTGRAVARIFHGIMSPNYPAVIWGRCKYWRCHMNVDFHTICRIATREILNFR